MDGLRMTPTVGAFFDGVNALSYMGHGDIKNAGMSLIAFVPIIGEAATPAKHGVKVAKIVSNADSISDAAKYIGKYGDDFSD